MDKPVAAPAAGAKEKVEKQARQLAYDTRYKVKQSMKAKAGGRIDPAAMRKAFISQLAKSPSAPAIKARAKQMLMGEGYIDVKDLVQEHASKALFKVFVEHHQKDENGNTIPHEGEEISEGKDGEKTYKVRVTDKKTGNSYVRMASRAKIADLRNNPNISSVEMTGYGEPTKSEKHKGSSTAKAKAGKGLDPVGKEDSDVDNDGDVDSSDKYLTKRRKAIGKAIAKEDKVWTGFKELIEKKEEKEKKITGEGVDNKKLIKVFPDEVKEEVETKEEPKQDQGLKQKQRKANMAKKQVLMKKMQAVRMGAGDQIMASKEPDGDLVDEGMKDQVVDKKKKEEQEDPRSMPTKVNLVKNKMRSMGLNMQYDHGSGLVDAYNQVHKGQQIDEILEKGTKGKIGFRSGGQFKDTGKKTSDGTPIKKYVQSMKTDKVTVMNKGTKASGGKKARKRPQSPYGKAVGALSKHRDQQWSAERKMKDARKRGDKKEADKQWNKARSAEDKRKKQSGTLFDKTGSFHDRADND